MTKAMSILSLTGFALIIFAVYVAIFYFSLNDPSAGAPLYVGPIIQDPNQHPIASGFNHETEAIDVVKGLDLTGKTIVITAGHSGTGLEAVKAFTGAGATVIALARDVKWAEENLKGIPNVYNSRLREADGTL